MIKRQKADTGKGRNWILQNGRGQYGKILLLSLGCMVHAGIGVGLALALKAVVDYAVEGNGNGFIYAAIWTAGMIGVQIMLGYGIRSLDERTRVDLENTWKGRVWMKIMTRDYASLEQFHTGELMNRLSGDVRLVADSVVTLVPNLLSMLTRLFAAMVILFFLDWRFALIFMAGGLLVMGVSVIFRKKMKALHRQMQEAEGKVRSFQQEMMENTMVIRSFQAEQTIEEINQKYMQEHKAIRLKKNLFSNLTQTGFSGILNLGYLFGIFWCGLGILNHTITYGTLLAVQQLIGQIQQPIAGMAGIIPKYYAMLASAERLMELEEMPGDMENDRQEEPETTLDMKEIRLESYTTGYGREKGTVLEQISLQINEGDVMAITGESGAGKSTLLKALLCLYPKQEGQMILVRKDGKNLPFQKSMRTLFAYVPQGNFLMSGTIREAVSFYGMKGSVTVEEACHIACAADFIEKLQMKYDTVLGERGVGLSEGQMQRLAIARAIYMGNPVLLLDEATSALDGDTEIRVLRNIQALHNKTILIVTHRPAALEICNRIVEISGKKITEKMKQES